MPANKSPMKNHTSMAPCLEFHGIHGTPQGTEQQFAGVPAPQGLWQDFGGKVASIRNQTEGRILVTLDSLASPPCATNMWAGGVLSWRLTLNPTNHVHRNLFFFGTPLLGKPCSSAGESLGTFFFVDTKYGAEKRIPVWKGFCSVNFMCVLAFHGWLTQFEHCGVPLGSSLILWVVKVRNWLVVSL